MRTVIITGGSRGLGLALVQGLLEGGYRVSTCSRSPSEEVAKLTKDRDYGDRVMWLQCAVGDAAQAQKFVDATVDWAKDDRLYGLINNAGVAASGILATFPDVESRRILETDLLGSLQMAREVLRVLLQTTRINNDSGGRIINISSIVGSRGYTGLAAYAAAKGGMDAMGRSLAREVGRRQITVNSVAPGYMTTELSSTLSQGQVDQVINRTPLGRLCSFEDVVSVVKFLLSDEAGFITGQTLTIDGGLSC